MPTIDNSTHLLKILLIECHDELWLNKAKKCKETYESHNWIVQIYILKHFNHWVKRVHAFNLPKDLEVSTIKAFIKKTLDLRLKKVLVDLSHLIKEFYKYPFRG